jgi:4-alpha-glucanotransferase
MRFPRASGILLHPTSLPGPHGSGDFGPAAYHFVDWLAAGEQHLWQVLPLGGIGPGNSPYMSSSAFAGNVLLIDLAELAQHGWLTPAELAPDAGFDLQRMNYAAVWPWRMHRLALAAQRFAHSASTAMTASYQRFCVQHEAWLDDYALFMALAEHHGWRDWCDWDDGLVARRPAALQAARQQHAERVAFWKFCQWQFFEQWHRLKAYANQRGVRIVGDAPIFIAYQSADCWARQDLFELGDHGRPTVIAGVPPDYFSATGQRWGNPLYRWPQHAQEGYAWWIQRLRHTCEMVDIVRIDHFRGFAGYWEIPASEPTAVKGRWLPGPGAALFSAIAQALGPLPIIAEDLGEITPDVHVLRKQFAFPGMRVLHFAWAADATDRFLPHNHEADTVVYTGTHDNDTTLGWWAGATPRERQHLCDYLATDGSDIAWTLIRAACASVADTAIYPMQDVLALPTEHRMNFPGKAEGYWEWRFDWSQVEPRHAQRLAHLARLYGRTGSPPPAS